MGLCREMSVVAGDVIPISKVIYHCVLSVRRLEGLKSLSKRTDVIKGTLPRKSTWALNVQFSEKTTMVPFIWM